MGLLMGKPVENLFVILLPILQIFPQVTRWEKHRLVILFPMKCVLLVVLLLLQKLVICTN